MDLADNIKKIREQKNIMQKEVAAHIKVDKSTYSKIEKGLREITAKELILIAKLFDTTVDDIANFEGNTPKEITITNKTAVEQMNLINQLDEEDKSIVFKMVDKMLTSKKFKDFFQKNVATL